MARKKTQVAEADESGARRILLLNRWLKAAATLLGADRACIVLNDGKLARVIARHDIPHAFLSTERTLQDAPYPPDAELVIRDARDRPDIMAFLSEIAGPSLGFFYRCGLVASPGRSLSLVIFGSDPRPDLDERDLDLVRELAVRMAEEADRQFPAEVADGVASLGMTSADLTAWLHGTDLPAALFDERLQLVAVNPRLRQLVPTDWNRLIGTPLQDWREPVLGGLQFFFGHALDTGVSTPRIDLDIAGLSAESLGTTLSVRGAPVRTIDGGRMLVATVDPASLRVLLEAGGNGSLRQEEATVAFLLKTLVQRRALRSRNGVSFLTLRSWRQPIREHQISALKAIKRHAVQALANDIAGEIADDVRSLLGVGGFKGIVPMPCGHSAPDQCLSLAIAQALGHNLRLPVLHALALPTETGGSHPKSNTRRDAIRLVAAVEGPVLLTDDVATSGRHIEEAVGLLRQANAAAMAIAWIGGDASSDD